MISGADVQEHEREMQCRGTATQRRRVADADARRQLPLEGIDFGPEGRDPVGVEGLEQQGPLVLALWGGER